MTSPCKDCAKRVSGCHSRCPEYAKYEKENERRREAHHMDVIMAKRSPSQAARFKKDTMERLRNAKR